MEKISSLTSEQHAKLLEDREKYLQIGLNTNRADRPAVEFVANEVRKFLGFQEAPSQWFEGPASAVCAAHMMQHSKVLNGPDDKPSPDLINEFLQSIDFSKSISAQISEHVKKTNASFSMPVGFYGGSEIYWVAYYLWPHENIRPIHTDEQVQQLQHWLTLCHSGWWFPYDTINILCEPPAEIHRADNLLHNDSGPAVLFRDGWRHWSLTGVTVDEQIVMRPETQSVKQIREEDNEEVRRIRIERFGWDRYLGEANARVLEVHRNDIEGTDESLMECDEMRVLVCACPSTGRVYGMEVPPEVSTCREAQNWLRNTESGYSIGAS